MIVALALLASCSRAAPEKATVEDAGVTMIPVTPGNTDGTGIPKHFVRVVSGKHVEMWADPSMVEIPK